MTNTPSEILPVEQRHRDAAAALIESYWPDGSDDAKRMRQLAQSYRAGHSHGAWVQAFVRFERDFLAAQRPIAPVSSETLTAVHAWLDRLEASQRDRRGDMMMLGVADSEIAQARFLLTALDQAVEALRPFAAIAELADEKGHEPDSTCTWRLRASDLHNARRTLQIIEGSNNGK